MTDLLDDIYDLTPEEFFKRCLAIFRQDNLYSDFESFCTDQLEHLELTAKKYRHALENNLEPKISKDQFIRLKKYKKYFTQIRVKQINTFDELFEQAIQHKKIETPINDHHRASLLSQHQLCFNVWLQKNKQWEIEDEIDYIRLLTPENFITYLKDDAEELRVQKLILQSQEDEKRLLWQPKDTSYQIGYSVEEIKATNPDYKGLEREINNNGHIKLNTGNEKVKIFTPVMAFILFFDLKARNVETDEELIFNKSDYIESFVNGFNEGKAYFKEEFSISTDTLYSNPKAYVENLHFQFYHLENDDTHEGWRFVQKKFPLILNHKEIKKHGFYSGVISALFEMMDKHPIPFKSFKEKCDYYSEQEGDTDKMKPEAINEENKENYVLVNSIDEYLDTLGITGTDVSTIVEPKPTAIVNGNGSDMKDNKVLQKRAKQKTIAQKVILALIDDAKKKGKDKWVKSLWNAYRCQGVIVTTNDKLFGRYCKYRICPICSSIRKAEKINDYLPELKTWTDAHFVTLTLKSVPAYRLKPVIDSMVEEWTQIIDTYKKREQRKTGKKLTGIKSLECNFNPKRGTYNPHYHIIVPTQEMAEILIREWLTRSNPGWTHRKGQYERKVVNTERDMIETVKYGTKILTEPDPRKKKYEKGKRKVYISALNNILMAFDGHHLFGRFGFNLPIKKIKPESKTTCVTDHKNWEFEPAVSDWVDSNSGDRLTGYLPPSDLVDILKEGIETELE